MRTVLAVFVVWSTPTLALAQSVMIAGGYDWAHPDFENVHLFSGDLNGWRGGVVVQVAGGLGVVAEASGLYGPAFNTGIVIRPRGTARPWLYSVEAGPRYTVNTATPFSPFIDGLLGVVHGQAGTMGIDFLGTTTDTRLEGGFDGGVTIHVTRALGLEGRVAFRWSRLFDQRLSRVQVGGAMVWWVRSR